MFIVYIRHATPSFQSLVFSKLVMFPRKRPSRCEAINNRTPIGKKNGFSKRKKKWRRESEEKIDAAISSLRN